MGELPVLVLMVGLPKSGKTTWARAHGAPIVSPDAIRLALHGQRYVQEAEVFVWAHARLMVRSLFLAGHDEVIVDACNVSRERREEWRGEGWKRGYQVMDTPKEECVRRAVEAGDEVMLPVIERMAGALELPGRDELG